METLPITAPLTAAPACEPQMIFKTAHGEVSIFRSAREIPQDDWRGSLCRECMDSRYYEVVEETLPREFEYRYAFFREPEDGSPAVQPFFLVDQDIAAGLPKGLQSLIGRFRGRFPRFLKMRILMIGCAAGEGRLGGTNPAWLGALHEAIAFYARREGVALMVFKDLPAHYRTGWFSRNGYKRIPSMPAAKLDLGFASFEEYLQTRPSRIYRKSLRRKFRDIARLGEVNMEVLTDITPLIKAVYPLYQQTFARSSYRFEELTPEYFCELGQRMPERVRFFVWRYEGRIVAFSVCMIHNGTLHDLNIGLDYSLAFRLHLYFLTWRDIVSWALKAGLRTYYTGPLNYHPKLHLRMELAPLDLYVRHLSPLLNPVFKFAMDFLQPARYDASIPKFPNAHEL